MAARLPASGGGSWPIVLTGHRDTVFPDGTATQRPVRIVRIDGNQAFGPGVADMKSGLVANTFLLEAFRRFARHARRPGSTHHLFGLSPKLAQPPYKVRRER